MKYGAKRQTVTPMMAGMAVVELVSQSMRPTPSGLKDLVDEAVGDGRGSATPGTRRRWA